MVYGRYNELGIVVDNGSYINEGSPKWMVYSGKIH